MSNVILSLWSYFIYQSFITFDIICDIVIILQAFLGGELCMHITKGEGCGERWAEYGRLDSDQ